MAHTGYPGGPFMMTQVVLGDQLTRYSPLPRARMSVTENLDRHHLCGARFGSPQLLANDELEKINFMLTLSRNSGINIFVGYLVHS